MILENYESDRLRFRSLQENDLDPLMEFFEDPVATALFDIEGSREAFGREWIARQQRRYAADGFGLCALTLKATGELVGMCGLITQTVDGQHELEVGYHLTRKFWGNGYASEAAIACRDFAFEREMSESIISIIHIDNEASRKVARRNGMTQGKLTTYITYPIHVHRIAREEWLSLKRLSD